MSLIGALSARLLAHASHAVLAEGAGEQRRVASAMALLARAASFRSALAGLGVRPGDRVALVGELDLDWVACDLAALAEGAVSVPVDPRRPAAEVASRVRGLEPRVVVLGDGAPELPRLVRAARQQSLEALRALGGPTRWRPPRALPGDALATVAFSRGRGGEARRALLTHEALAHAVAAAEGALAALSGAPLGRDRTLVALPPWRIGARVFLHAALRRVARIELAAREGPLLEALARARAEYMLVSPRLLARLREAAEAAVAARGPIVQRLLREVGPAAERRAARRATWRDRLLLRLAERLAFPAVRAPLGGRMQALICGGAPLSAQSQEFFRRAGVEVLQAWGCAETAGVGTLDRPGEVRPGWVGSALPGVELARAEDGELLVRGPLRFTGYLAAPEATTGAFAPGGFVRTGDLAEVDEQGRWRILGRRRAGAQAADPRPSAPPVAAPPTRAR